MRASSTAPELKKRRPHVDAWGGAVRLGGGGFVVWKRCEVGVDALKIDERARAKLLRLNQTGAEKLVLP
jgi:hypothetical protein